MSDLFPDPAGEFDQGLVAVGGDLSFKTLQEAYTKGIFPWPQEDYPMLWFCPDKRGVLQFKNFKLPTSFKKKLKKYESFKVTRDRYFEGVIRECARQKRKGQRGTWITRDIIEAYVTLHKKGHARSWEVWEGENLVGGGYGVMFNGVFSGESLFHRKTDMSKLALLAMVQDLEHEGHTWMDTQMVTPLLAQFGAEEIPKKQYLKMLAQRHLETDK